jgi:hypothetical protein
MTKKEIAKKYIKVRKLWGKWQTKLVVEDEVHYQCFYIDTTAESKEEAQLWADQLAIALERMIREVTK